MWHVNAIPLSYNVLPAVEGRNDDQFIGAARQKRGCIPGYTLPGGCSPLQQNEYLSPPSEYLHDLGIAKSYPDDLQAFLFGS